MGWLPAHPAVIIPPLLGLVTTKVEKRSLEGLGLPRRHPLCIYVCFPSSSLRTI